MIFFFFITLLCSKSDSKVSFRFYGLEILSIWLLRFTRESLFSKFSLIFPANEGNRKLSKMISVKMIK